MKRYLRVYKLLLKMNFSALMMYRGNFISSLMASLSWGIFSLFSVVLLTSKTQSIFGWERGELLLLNGVYGIVIGVFHTVFSRNFDRFSTIIHLGQLDTILVKPIDSQFLLSFWHFWYVSLLRILLAGVYSYYFISFLHLQISIEQWGLFMLLALAGLVTLYSIWYIVITLTIWFTRLSNLVDLMFTLTGIARYPQEILHQVSEYIFIFLLPLTLVITLPTKSLLHRLGVYEVVFVLILACSFFFISRKFWRFALRYYTSASS